MEPTKKEAPPIEEALRVATIPVDSTRQIFFPPISPTALYGLMEWKGEEWTVIFDPDSIDKAPLEMISANGSFWWDLDSNEAHWYPV